VEYSWSSKRREDALREDRNEERSIGQTLGAAVVATEALRTSPPTSGPESSAKGEEHISPFWRIFGGTLLSIAALGVITLCQYFNNGLNGLRADLDRLSRELQKDMGRLAENQANLMKKEEFNLRMKSVWEGLKEVRDEQAGFTALKERFAMTERRLKESADEYKETLKQLQELRERRAGEDARKELVQELQRVRERLAAIEGRHGAESALKPAVHNEPTP
jgi:DNA repair exonuclease SbcCD ATPase subunit